MVLSMKNIYKQGSSMYLVLTKLTVKNEKEANENENIDC